MVISVSDSYNGGLIPDKMPRRGFVFAAYDPT